MAENSQSDSLVKEGAMLIRWGIPGSVFFGAFLFFVALDFVYSLCVSHFTPASLIERLGASKYFGDQGLVGMIAFLVAASIPSGFVISQLYYFGVWAGIPFATRRTPEKIVNQQQLQQIDELSETDRMIQTREMQDWTLWRELIVRFLLGTIYVLKLLVHYPLWLLKILIMGLSCLFGMRIYRERIPPPKRETYEEVVKAHIRWIVLSSICYRKAKGDESSRLVHLGNVFDGIGTTFISVLVAWLFFTYLDFHLPYASAGIWLATKRNSVLLVTLVPVLILFLVFWQNRKSVARHQLLLMRLLLRSDYPDKVTLAN